MSTSFVPVAGRTLRALIDGVALPDEEARSLWQRFSAWMEEHRGDLGGFATSEGFKSVHPGVENGQPTLFVSRSNPQGPYVSVHRSGDAAQTGSTTSGDIGGSDSRHEPPATNRSHGRSRRRNSRN